MGKAHSRALARARASSTRRSCRELVSICGPRPRRRASGRAPARLGRGRRRLARAGRRRARRAVRQRRPERAPRRADDRRRAGRQARPLREAARRSTRREAHEMWRAARGRGRRPRVRLQLPLRARRSGRARELVEPRASSARSSTSARATSSRGAGTRRPTSGASTAPRPGTGAIGDLGAHIDRPRPLPRRRDRDVSARSCGRSSPAARSTTRSPRRSSSQAARSARSRRRASRAAASTRTPSRSTARAARSPSTSSASTSCSSRTAARTASSTCTGDWWPPGHVARLGRHVHARVRAPARRDRGRGHRVAPHGATFEDGYRAAEVCDAILRSAESGRTREDRVPMKTSLGIWALGPMVDALRPGRLPAAVGRRVDRGQGAARGRQGSAT